MITGSSHGILSEALTKKAFAQIVLLTSPLVKLLSGIIKYDSLLK